MVRGRLEARSKLCGVERKLSHLEAMEHLARARNKKELHSAYFLSEEYFTLSDPILVVWLQHTSLMVQARAWPFQTGDKEAVFAGEGRGYSVGERTGGAAYLPLLCWAARIEGLPRGIKRNIAGITLLGIAIQ